MYIPLDVYFCYMRSKNYEAIDQKKPQNFSYLGLNWKQTIFSDKAMTKLC